MREYDTYKAVYCGLCHQLGHTFGPLARFTLSYDFTFLAMLAMAVTEEKPAFDKCACFINPLKKSMTLCDCPSLLYSADAAIIMFYYKMLDNQADQRGLKKWGARLALIFLSKPHQQAAKRFPHLEEALATASSAQTQLEQEHCNQIDRACEPTAQALSKICEQLTQDTNNRRVLNRFGYLLGRYIYLCDALDDLEEDQKSGNYNPFLQAAEMAGEPNLQQCRQQAMDTLYMTIGEIGKTYSLLALTNFEPILSNVVYLGLKHTVSLIINKRSDQND